MFLVINCLAILILDSSGDRILTRYYETAHLPASQPPLAHHSQFITEPQPNPYPTVKQQKKFEKDLFAKTKNQNTDVLQYDHRVVTFKHVADTAIYVVGGSYENEIMLYQVVVSLKDCLDRLLKYSYPVKGLTIVTP
jgi:coatomer subunit zeta